MRTGGAVSPGYPITSCKVYMVGPDQTSISQGVHNLATPGPAQVPCHQAACVVYTALWRPWLGCEAAHGHHAPAARDDLHSCILSDVRCCRPYANCAFVVMQLQSSVASAVAVDHLRRLLALACHAGAGSCTTAHLLLWGTRSSDLHAELGGTWLFRLKVPHLVATALQDKAYAFLEFRTVEEASNAMAFDGMVLDGSYLKVGSSLGVLQYLSPFPWKRCHIQCAMVPRLGPRWGISVWAKSSEPVPACATPSAPRLGCILNVPTDVCPMTAGATAGQP